MPSTEKTLEPGTKLGPYEIRAFLGAGAMGAVFRAHDVRLGRDVAVKVLTESARSDPTWRARFEREARAVGAINHPNVIAVYDVGVHEDTPYLVCELLTGETLRDKLKHGPLPVARALQWAEQIARGLAAAHDRGLVHRDLKPANLFITRDGIVKILDFGLAKAAPRPGPNAEATLDAKQAMPEPLALTEMGAVLGTLGYMAPEQVLGRPADHRADLFAFGVVLYEMLAGRPPFAGPSAPEVAFAILADDPPALPAGTPPGVQRLVQHCLEKDPAARFQSPSDLIFALETLGTPSLSAGDSVRRPASLEEVAAVPARARRRRAGVAAAAVAVAALAILVGWLLHSAARARWARETATPQVERLLDAEEYAQAAALSDQALAVLPGDATLEKLRSKATFDVSIESTPAGAEVRYRPYRSAPTSWLGLGRTPLSRIPVPRDFYVWQLSARGYVPAWQIAPDQVHGSGFELSFRLAPEGSVPPGMVRVPGAEIKDLVIPGLGALPRVAVYDFLIDRYEVTNEEYKKFVDAGGYQRPELWQEAFVRDGRPVPWEQAMAAFQDGTGRPGASIWELGTFAKDRGAHPVAGVSWYEAAAYCAFAGKSLPTIYHWTRAAQLPMASVIVVGSNFAPEGTVPVGGDGSLGGFGTYDMAGNVKEWALNESQSGKRYVLGGGFGEPTYMFIKPEAQSPWTRTPNIGVRCVKLSVQADAQAIRPIEEPFRDFRSEKPVSDEVFRVYQREYAYDRTGLDVRVESTEETDVWTRERVSFDAAYGGERVIAYLYLPKNARPPFQTVVYFPGASALLEDKFSLSVYADYIPRSGRALLAPIYKSTFERHDKLKQIRPEPTAFYRDHMIAWSKDLGRSLDYLETRPDIDHDRIAYLGFSWGGAVAPILLAVEERFKVAVLQSGGLFFQRTLPEVEVTNYARRVHVPVLMLNGRYDSIFPVATSQEPMFELLGTPAESLKHIVYDAGHVPPRKEVIRECLSWLDRYLGPVGK